MNATSIGYAPIEVNMIAGVATNQTDNHTLFSEKSIRRWPSS